MTQPRLSDLKFQTRRDALANGRKPGHNGLTRIDQIPDFLRKCVIRPYLMGYASGRVSRLDEASDPTSTCYWVMVTKGCGRASSHSNDNGVEITLQVFAPSFKRLCM
jgi:hypothetical protein